VSVPSSWSRSRRSVTVARPSSDDLVGGADDGQRCGSYGYADEHDGRKKDRDRNGLKGLVGLGSRLCRLAGKTASYLGPGCTTYVRAGFVCHRHQRMSAAKSRRALAGWIARIRASGHEGHAGCLLV